VRITRARETYGKDGATKTRRTRWVDLPEQLCDRLAARIEDLGLGPNDRVWSGEQGGPVNHKSFYSHRYKPVVVALSEEGLLPMLEVDDDQGDGDPWGTHGFVHGCRAAKSASRWSPAPRPA
jgi:hypothetical protein